MTDAIPYPTSPRDMAAMLAGHNTTSAAQCATAWALVAIADELRALREQCAECGLRGPCNICRRAA